MADFVRGFQFVMQTDPLLGWFIVVVLGISIVCLLWEVAK